jgi:hypothetical protein
VGGSVVRGGGGAVSSVASTIHATPLDSRTAALVISSCNYMHSMSGSAAATLFNDTAN